MRLLIVGTLLGYITEAGRIALDRGAKVAHAETIDQALRGVVQTLFDVMLPRGTTELGSGPSLTALLDENGFDRAQHEQVSALRPALRAGRGQAADLRVERGLAVAHRR